MIAARQHQSSAGCSGRSTPTAGCHTRAMAPVPPPAVFARPSFRLARNEKRGSQTAHAAGKSRGEGIAALLDLSKLSAAFKGEPQAPPIDPESLLTPQEKKVCPPSRPKKSASIKSVFTSECT